MIDWVVVYCDVFDCEYWELVLFVVIVGVIFKWVFESVLIVVWVCWIWLDVVFEDDFCVGWYL